MRPGIAAALALTTSLALSLAVLAPEGPLPPSSGRTDPPAPPGPPADPVPPAGGAPGRVVPALPLPRPRAGPWDRAGPGDLAGPPGRSDRELPVQGRQGTKVPRLLDAERQLAHATLARRSLANLRGSERWRARVAAAEACRAVRVHFPEARAEGAEAAFRAGELWRAGGEDERARIEFEAVLTLDGEGPFGLRARLELAHLERRAGRTERALARYLEVLAREAESAWHATEARLWAGRMQLELGARELARALWRDVAESARDPLQRIEAFDFLAGELVESGDLEGAAGMLERCRQVLFEDSAELTERGRRVRDALTDMGSRRALVGAVRRRREAVPLESRSSGAIRGATEK